MSVGMSKATLRPWPPCSSSGRNGRWCLAGATEAGELANRPRLAAIPSGVDAAREWELPWPADAVESGNARCQRLGAVDRRERRPESVRGPAGSPAPIGTPSRRLGVAAIHGVHGRSARSDRVGHPWAKRKHTVSRCWTRRTYSDRLVWNRPSFRIFPIDLVGISESRRTRDSSFELPQPPPSAWSAQLQRRPPWPPAFVGCIPTPAVRASASATAAD